MNCFKWWKRRQWLVYNGDEDKQIIVVFPEEQFLAIVAKQYATRPLETATMETINKRLYLKWKVYKLSTKTSIWNTKHVLRENNYAKFIVIFIFLPMYPKTYPLPCRTFQFVSETTWKLILKTKIRDIQPFSTSINMSELNLIHLFCCLLLH